MKTHVPVARALRWRLLQAEAVAPPAPRAARLLERARPWWERWPEEFRSLADRLAKMQVACGHAMADACPGRGGNPVPALVSFAGQEIETHATVVSLKVRDGWLAFRFRLDAEDERFPERLEVTFVGATPSRPLLSAPAGLSVAGECRVHAELPAELARAWERLQVADRMPFRMLLHSAAPAG